MDKVGIWREVGLESLFLVLASALRERADDSLYLMYGIIHV